MKREDMTKLINEELIHIPKVYGDKRQSELRMIYNASRLHDLKIGKPREETLSSCMESLKKSHPSWNPTYDSSFFKL